MRRFPLFLVVSLWLCCAAPAFAADPTHGPPPGPLEIFYDTAIWATVVFVGMLLILRAKAWGPIVEGLKKREETIRSALEEAKKTREEMTLIHEQLQKELAEAHQQIPKLMEEARKKAEELSNEMRARAAADIQAERERLRHEVEIAKDQAIQELWTQAAQLATLISAKAIGRSLTQEDHHRLLDEAMTEMRQGART